MNFNDDWKHMSLSSEQLIGSELRLRLSQLQVRY